MTELDSLNVTIKTLVVEKVLGEFPFSKKIFVKGSFPDKEGVAVVILEKDPISVQQLPNIFEESLPAEILFKNDIYTSFKHFPKVELSGLKTTLIYPATEDIVKKYTVEPNLLINETPELHREVTAPYISKTSKSCQWVYNILDHSAESERIVYEDNDQEKGYILLPDLKWDGSNSASFYLQALPHKRGIRSIRDLTAEHLPLLRNINETAIKAISEKYNIDKSTILVYLHYLPSFFHLHVHFNLINTEHSMGVERCYLLSTVIQNIEICSDYYQRATLTLSLKSSDELTKLLLNGDKTTDGNATPIADL